MQQINKTNILKQSNVIRIVNNVENGEIRHQDERFFSEEDQDEINFGELAKQAIRTKPDFFMIPPLIKNWYICNIEKFNDLPYLKKIKKIVQLSIEGIKRIGKKLEDVENTFKIINKLNHCLDLVQDPNILFNRVANIYTMESFVYKILNKNLRENKLEYLNEIGPFGYLLYEFIRYRQMYSALDIINNKPTDHYNVLWRATRLNDQILSLYNPETCPYFIWYAFTSTTSNKENVENFCKSSNNYINTIFQIIIDKNIFCQTINIKDFSSFPKEDEVLLQAASVFEIQKHEVIDNIHYITMKLIPNENIVNNLKIMKNQLELVRNKWLWSKGDPWNQKACFTEWQEYSEKENYIIEYNYLQGKKYSRIGNYNIDYDALLQYDVENPTKVRLIKRHEKYNKDEFETSYLKILVDENMGKILSPLILYWYCKFIKENNCSYIEKWKLVIQEIYKGIKKESQLTNNRADRVIGERFAEKIKSTANKYNYNRLNIFKELISVYIEESFFYKVVNRALRDNDSSKIENIGAYCFLFNELMTYYDSLKQFRYHGKVWRGVVLYPEMIEYYKENKGNYIYWPAFSSTTKDKVVAEFFGSGEDNCIIFEIDLDSRGIDIEKFSKYYHSIFNYNKSDLSIFKHEKEVLIHAGTLMKVKGYEKKDFITYFYLSSCSF